MVNGLLGLLGGHRVEVEQIQSWLADWSQAYDAIQEETRPVRLHPYRKDYYRKAFDAMIGSSEPKAVLWPLLNTWTLAASTLSTGNPTYQGWQDACQQLELISSDLSERMAALDAFLDQVEEAISKWVPDIGY